MRIDSLTKYEELIASGFPEAQAKSLAHGFAGASEIDMSNIATKDDIIATKADISNLEKRINVHFKYMHLIEVVIFLGIIGIFVQGAMK
jgi:hypothetical protein